MPIGLVIQEQLFHFLQQQLTRWTGKPTTTSTKGWARLPLKSVVLGYQQEKVRLRKGGHQSTELPGDHWIVADWAGFLLYVAFVVQGLKERKERSGD